MLNIHRSDSITRLVPGLVVILAFVLCSSDSRAAQPQGNGKPSGDISVTTTISDQDLNNLPTTIGSDGLGAYQDGVAGISSILTANTCGGLPTGDWRFDSQSSTSRSVSEGLFLADEVQPGDPHYQAPANPPYLGSQPQRPWMNVQCTCEGKDMSTMTGGSYITCGMNNNWHDLAGNKWSLDPGFFPEATAVMITCNSTATDGLCNDWFIDPDPSQGTEAVGRLFEVPARGKPASINDGDFYMRFHIHITRP